MFVRITFNRKDLEPLLAQAMTDRMGITIKPDDIFDFAWQEDEDGDVAGVAIEFELPEGKSA